MLLTDYLRSEPDITWEYAKQCGVKHGVIRLPEEEAFDMTDKGCFEAVVNRFQSHGITPVVIEPMPNCVHDHIKAGDDKRDESIDKVIKMMALMDQFDIRTICFNFMAHIGWLRTDNNVRERGGALVTGFDLPKFEKGLLDQTLHLMSGGVMPGEGAGPVDITEEELWYNYEYFLKAVIPYAERYHIKLALHPDDPPISPLGGVSRIMISYENIQRAMQVVKSDQLGLTFCQACYLMMGEDLYDIIPKLREKIFFVHFRNVTGNKYHFHETFHDNGEIDMAKILRLYQDCGIDVPIRLDHVPTMAGESEKTGYSALGRLFAIGYLKGLLQATQLKEMDREM